MKLHPEVALRGERNECPTCGELFKSNEAFDKHRTGGFGGVGVRARRCRTVAEMTAIGMGKNAAGFWVTRHLAPDARASQRANAGSDFSKPVGTGTPPAG